MSTIPAVDSQIDFNALRERFKPVTHHCLVCDEVIPATRRFDTTTCSQKCRQRLYMARKAAKATTNTTPGETE